MNNIIKRKWNQNSMVIIEDLHGMAFQAESGGHTFQISGIDGEGNAVALSGTPAGVMLRADGQDVTLTCSVSGGVVSATLPANAYSVPGRFSLTIFLTSDGQKTAIYAAVGTVGKTSSGTVAPPAGSDVVTLVNQINTAIAAIPANYNACFAPAYSTSGLYSVGQYVTYNGNLYRCNTAITTAETWTAAHWTQTNLGADVYDLKSALTTLESGVGTVFYNEQSVTHQTQLFTSSDVSVGDFVAYSMLTQLGKAGYIELLDANNTRLAYYGKGSSSDTQLEWSGTFTIPEGFAKAVLQATSSGASVTMHYLYSVDKYDIPIEEVNNRVDILNTGIVSAPLTTGSARVWVGGSNSYLTYDVSEKLPVAELLSSSLSSEYIYIYYKLKTPIPIESDPYYCPFTAFIKGIDGNSVSGSIGVGFASNNYATAEAYTNMYFASVTDQSNYRFASKYDSKAKTVSDSSLTDIVIFGTASNLLKVDGVYISLAPYSVPIELIKSNVSSIDTRLTTLEGRAITAIYDDFSTSPEYDHKRIYVNGSWIENTSENGKKISVSDNLPASGSGGALLFFKLKNKITYTADETYAPFSAYIKLKNENVSTQFSVGLTSTYSDSSSYADLDIVNATLRKSAFIYKDDEFEHTSSLLSLDYIMIKGSFDHLKNIDYVYLVLNPFAEALNSEENTPPYITCWGDSLTAMGAWPPRLASLTGMTVHNCGIGGEAMRQIIARQGADVYIVNDIEIPATTTPVQIGDWNTQIKTQMGNLGRPLLQGGSTEFNPCKLGDIQGTVVWTGETSSDTSGTYTFTRSEAGEAVSIIKDTPIRTKADMEWNSPYLMIIFMGENDVGYNNQNPSFPDMSQTFLDQCLKYHHWVIDHAKAENYLILGLPEGDTSHNEAYEEMMKKEFGRYFFSLREYLAHPIYENGSVVNCYGLQVMGLTATSDDLADIAIGKVPARCFMDGIHFSNDLRPLIGNIIYEYCKGLNMF